MRKLHLLWKFAFYLRFTFTLLSYSKSILSQFTHKSHATERGGHSSTMFGFCSVNDLLLLLPLYHLLSNHITNFFTLGSNVSLILFKYSQKYEVFLHFDLRNCEDMLFSWKICRNELYHNYLSMHFETLVWQNVETSKSAHIIHNNLLCFILTSKDLFFMLWINLHISMKFHHNM